MILTLNNIYA